MEKNIIATKSDAKAMGNIFYVFLSIGLIALGVVNIITSESTYQTVIGWIGLIMFGLCFAILFWQMLVGFIQPRNLIVQEGNKLYVCVLGRFTSLSKVEEIVINDLSSAKRAPFGYFIIKVKSDERLRVLRNVRDAKKVAQEINSLVNEK